MSTPLVAEGLPPIDPRRPALFVNAVIHTLEPTADQPAGADLMITGTRITAAGPALPAGDATVVDCTGLAVVPVFTASGARLEPGDPATFAVIPAAAVEDRPFEKIIWWPSQAAGVLDNGRSVAPASFRPAPPPSASPHLGRWIDTSGSLVQDLTADGRYDETRGGRPHAYQGSFQIVGDRIVYRDDLGFWAYGRFADGLLHHAGYTLARG